MERIQDYGLLFGQAHAVGNGVHPTDMALALLDAGIAAGAFGYGNGEAHDAVRFVSLDEARLETLSAEDAFSHETALFAQGRKSKLSMLRGESDGSVRGLRNAVISLGYWHELSHGPEDAGTAPEADGQAEGWRIGWSERLSEIMQLSVDGPLEEMGSVPLRETVPGPFRDEVASAAGDAAQPGLSDAGRAFLAAMLEDEDEADPETFVFAGPEDAGRAPHALEVVAAQEEVIFVESQYAALHGALYDGDPGWHPHGEAEIDNIFAPDGPAERPAHEAELNAFYGHWA